MANIPGHVTVACHRCSTVHWLPNALWVVARANSAVHFYCPYGHAAHYPEGETEETRIRRERDQLKQQMAQKDDELKRAWATANDQAAQCKAAGEKAKAVAKKMDRTLHTGTCPCCRRNFVALQRHMKTKHPEFKAETVQ